MSTKKHYETTIIVNGALDDETINQVVTRVTEFMTRNGAEIAKTDHWGRKRLAYPIAKKNNGYYVQFTLDGPPELVQTLERSYQLEEHIIRYLTLQLEDKDLTDREDMRTRVAAEIEAAMALAAAEEEEDGGND